MKRQLVLILTGALALSLVGCPTKAAVLGPGFRRLC